MQRRRRLAIELLLEDAYDPLLYEEIAKANINRPEILRMILDSPDAPDEVRRQVGALMNLPVVPKTELLAERKPPEIRVSDNFAKDSETECFRAHTACPQRRKGNKDHLIKRSQ